MTSLAPTSSDLPPEIWNDRYQPLKCLGKKAGRRTWLADVRQTQNQVVVKLLTFSPEFEWNDLKLFEHEAATLRSLSYPAIPRYLDYFEFSTTPAKGFALVQSFIEAKSLEQRLKAEQTFTERDVQQIAQTC